MSAKYKSPSFLLPNELNTSANPANNTGINSLYSMDFSGSGDKIQTGLTPPLGDSSRSISLWFYTSNSSSHNICGYGAASQVSGHNGFDILTTTGNYVGIHLFGTAVIAGGTYNLNAWNHYVITYDGTTLQGYLNGIAVDSNNTEVVNTLSTNDFIIGEGVYTGFNGFSGKIDEVAIFNRALDSTEISALYDGSGSNIRPSNLMATDLNPVAYYPLGEQAQMQGYLGNEASSEWQFPNGVLQDYVMDFDGTDNINSEANISSVSSFTASIWINRDDSATQYIYGQWVDGTTASQSWVVQTVGGIVYFNVRDASLSVKSAISTTSLTTGIWYNIIAVWTGSNIKLYINNSLEDTTACGSMNNPSTAVKLAIGSSSNNVSPFNGKISNVVIWNSDQEANRDNIYNNGSPQTTYTVTPQNWWKLNADSVYTPSAPNYTTALSFNGTTDFIKLNSNTQNFTNFSLSFWCITGGGHYKSIVGSNASNEGGILKAIVVASGSIKYSDSTNSWVDISGALSSTTWNHILITYNNTGNSLKTYKNGTLITTKNPDYSGSSTNAHSIRYIGARYNTGFFNKYISNVALFDSELTASQALTLFNFGTPETNISFNPTHWWKLDDQTAIIDYGSGGINGTNNGATNTPGGVAVTPSWKIPSALPIPTINTTSALSLLNNSNGHIDLNPKFNFDLTSTNTISVWVNLDNFSGLNAVLTNNGTIGGSTATYTQLLVLTTGSVNNTIAFYTYTQGFSNPTANSGWRSNDIPKQEFENSWHHVMLVRDGQNVSWYYDGQPWGGGTITTTQTEITDVNCIGGKNGSNGLSGLVSNLAVWNSDQSTNVYNIYNNGQPQSSYTVTPNHLFTLDNLTTGANDVYSSSAGVLGSEITKVYSNVYAENIPVNGVSTTLPSTALQQSDLQFDSPYSNYSLSFNGTGDYVQSTSPIISGNIDRSISLWYKMNGSLTTRDTLMTLGVDADATPTRQRFGISIQGSQRIRAFIYVGDPDFNNTYNWGSIDLLDGNWHHVVLTYSNNDYKLYVDSRYIGLITLAQTLNTSDGVTIGGNWLNGSIHEPINASIDETAVFNTVLTDSQVLEIYNNGRPKDLTTFSGTAPVSWWRLGENAYFDNNSFVVPNSIYGAPNGTGSGTITTMISADAPGTYANGVGTNLDIVDRVGDAPLSTANSQSYNMIPDDKVPYVPGYVGLQTDNIYSMDFDGSALINLGNDNTLNITGSLSVSAWFKTLNNTASIMIATKDDGGSNRAWQLYMHSTGAIRFGINGVTAFATSSGVYDDGNWHHVVALYEPSNYVKLYIDGVADGEDTSSVPASINDLPSQDVVIGAYSVYDGGTRWNGQIDEVAIWDTALNAGQIKNDIYNASLPLSSNKTADLENNPNLSTPVAWYRMGD